MGSMDCWVIIKTAQDAARQDIQDFKFFRLFSRRGMEMGDQTYSYRILSRGRVVVNVLGILVQGFEYFSSLTSEQVCKNVGGEGNVGMRPAAWTPATNLKDQLESCLRSPLP